MDTNMSKNTTKVTMSQTTPKTMEDHLANADAIIAEFGATIPDLEEKEAELMETVGKAIQDKQPKAPKADKAPKAEPAPVDITSILAAIPDTFTPALLDKAFNLNDGGKTVRRHLRKNFAEAMSHNMKEKWAFTKADNSDILSYFAARYAFDAKAIG